MYQTRNEMRGKTSKPSIEEVPDDLLAAGSARLGQKVEVDQ